MVAFVQLLSPKTRRYMSRQHLRISDCLTIQYCTAVFGQLPPDQLLFGAGMGAFRLRWDRIFSHLGLPHAASDNGITPGSLRGSGATYLYHSTENIPLITWRGRWRRSRTLEAYIQEVGAFSLLTDVHPDVRARIAELASLAATAMQTVIAGNSV